MRKKSHIALGVGLVHGLDLRDRFKHKFTFYFASIWPDLTPSFLTKRHCMAETYEDFCEKLAEFVDRYRIKRDMGFASTFRMGVLMHHIADYFTYPHNTHFPGTLGDHVSYEEVLKKEMYHYIGCVLDATHAPALPTYTDIESIKAYLLARHKTYLSLPGNVKTDCSYAYMTAAVILASLLVTAEQKSLTPEVQAA